MKYCRVLAAITESPWAILPEKLDAIVELVQLRAAGVELGAVASARPAPKVTKSVGVLPIYGVIMQRMNMFTEFSGGTSTDELTTDLRALVNDDSVSRIVLDIDSPGGSVYGVQELAAEIRAAREIKPITAVANSLAASAAYWLGSQASEFLVTPSGDVGSIGVIATHVDHSQANEAAGLAVSRITAGQFKAEGNPDEPLNDEAREAMQARVDAYYEAFVSDVAAGRGISAETVRADYGEGRVFGAKQALAMGMVDRIATLNEAIYTPTPSRSNRTAAARATVLRQSTT